MGGRGSSREWGNTTLREAIGYSCRFPSTARGPHPAVCSSTELQLLHTASPALDTQCNFQPAAKESIGEDVETHQWEQGGRFGLRVPTRVSNLFPQLDRA